MERLERKIRVGLSLAMQHGCVLCSAAPAAAAMYTPYGGGGLRFYSLCERCADIDPPARNAAVEAAILKDQT